MARKSDGELTLGLELARLRKQMEQLPGMTAGEAKKMTIALEKEFQASKRASEKAARASQKAWSKAGQGIGGMLDRVVPGFGAMRSSMSEISGVASTAAPALASVAGPIAIITAAAAASAVGLYKAANAASEYVDQALILSETTGLATDTVVALDYAASAGGASLQELQAGLASFTKRAGDAVNKGGEAADAFDRIGVATTTSSGGVRDMDDILEDTLRQIGQMSSESEQATAALDLFGTRGAKLVAVLGEGGDALARWKEETAGMIDEAALKSSAEMDEALTRLRMGWDQLTLAVGSEFGPAIADVLGTIGRAIGKFAEMWKATEDLRWLLNSLNPIVLAYRLEVWRTSDAADEAADSQDELATSTEAAATAADEATARFDGLNKVLEDHAKRLRSIAVAQGSMTAAEAKAQEAAEGQLDALAPLIEHLEKEEAALERVRAERDAVTRAIYEGTGATQEERAAAMAAVQAQEERVAAARAEIDAAAELVLQTRELVLAEDDLKESKKRGAEASKAAEKADEERAAALAAASAAIAAATEDRLSDFERIDTAAQAEIDRLDELMRKHEGDTEVLDQLGRAQVEIVERAEREKKAVRDAARWERMVAEREAADGIASLVEEVTGRQVDAETAAYEELRTLTAQRMAAAAEDAAMLLEIQAEHEEAKLDIAEHYAQQRIAVARAEAASTARTFGDSFVTMMDASAEFADVWAEHAREGSEAQKRAALVSFRIQQASGIAQATINTALAISQGIAQFGPPPSPAGIAAIAAAAAIGTAQTVAIAAQSPPQLHIGGVAGVGGTPGHSGANQPDELLVRVREEEQLRVEPSGGAAQAPQEIRVVNQYRHRVYDDFMADNLRMPSSKVSRAIRASSSSRAGIRDR